MALNKLDFVLDFARRKLKPRDPRYRIVEIG